MSQRYGISLHKACAFACALLMGCSYPARGAVEPPSERSSGEDLSVSTGDKVTLSDRQSLEEISRKADPDGLTAFACPAGTPESGWLSAAQWGQELLGHTETKTDYLRIREVSWTHQGTQAYLAEPKGPAHDPERTLPHKLNTLAVAGDFCRPDMTRAQCDDHLFFQELRFLISQEPQPDSSKTSLLYIAVVRPEAAAVDLLATKAEFFQLFGKVDTPAEAWFWLKAAGGFDRLRCGDVASFGQKSTDDGFILRMVVEDGCRPSEVRNLQYRVGWDGEVVLLKDSLIGYASRACVVP